MNIEQLKKDLKENGKTVIRSVGTIRVHKRKARVNFEDKKKMKITNCISIKASRPFLRELNK